MKILLTGATGFIGKKFLSLASKKGFHIFAISRKKMKKKIKNVEWLKGEIDDNWGRYLSKVDVVVHLASSGVIKNKKENYENILNFNVIKSLNFVLNAIENNCRKFLIASTSSEYFNDGESNTHKLSVTSKRKSSSAYSLSKIIFTNILQIISKKTYCNFRILRIFPTYGKDEHKKRLYPMLKNYAQKNKNFHIKNPNEYRDFTKVDYVAKVLIDACEFKNNKKFEIFHVSSLNTLSVKEFAKRIWRKYKSKGKLTFNVNAKIFKRHISSKKSIWKIDC
jgi:nucleoside-diphosphate-sugar epimerase